MAIRAKFRVQEVTRRAWDTASEEVRLTAVTSKGPDDPNNSWSKATPGGELKMTISNPEAVGQLELGAEYLLTFEKAE